MSMFDYETEIKTEINNPKTQYDPLERFQKAPPIGDMGTWIVV